MEATVGSSWLLHSSVTLSWTASASGKKREGKPLMASIPLGIRIPNSTFPTSFANRRFPGGANSQGGCANLLFRKLFTKNCMKTKNLEQERGTGVPSIPGLGSSNVHIPPKLHDFFRKYVQKEATFCWEGVQNRDLSWSAISQLKPFRGFGVKIYNEFWAPFCAREQVAERGMF